MQAVCRSPSTHDSSFQHKALSAVATAAIAAATAAAIAVATAAIAAATAAAIAAATAAATAVATISVRPVSQVLIIIMMGGKLQEAKMKNGDDKFSFIHSSCKVRISVI